MEEVKEVVEEENSEVQVIKRRGNPDFKTIRRTGPTTLEGHFKKSLYNYKINSDAKLLKEIRQCNNCPLGSKKIKIGSKEIWKPAKCPYYELNKVTCPVDVNDYIETMKKYYEALNNADPLEGMITALLNTNVAAHEMSRQMEMMQKGHPGFYALEWQKETRALLELYFKMKGVVPVNQEGGHFVNINILFDKLSKAPNRFNKPVEVIDIKQEEQTTLENKKGDEDEQQPTE